MKEEKISLGLSTIRRNRGISLQQIAESTKISVRSLEAIERGDFRKLPGGIYTTSYLRQYARAIDYDEANLLAAYYRCQGTPQRAVVARSRPKRILDSLRLVIG